MGINLGTVDRAVRVIGGGVLIAVGLFLVKGIFGIILSLFGALLIFSGTVGFCHVYKILNFRTSKKT